jgi:hypothetical protein
MENCLFRKLVLEWLFHPPATTTGYHDALLLLAL